MLAFAPVVPNFAMLADVFTDQIVLRIDCHPATIMFIQDFYLLLSSESYPRDSNISVTLHFVQDVLIIHEAIVPAPGVWMTLSFRVWKWRVCCESRPVAGWDYKLYVYAAYSKHWLVTLVCNSQPHDESFFWMGAILALCQPSRSCPDEIGWLKMIVRDGDNSLDSSLRSLLDKLSCPVALWVLSWANCFSTLMMTSGWRAGLWSVSMLESPLWGEIILSWCGVMLHTHFTAAHSPLNETSLYWPVLSSATGDVFLVT